MDNSKLNDDIPEYTIFNDGTFFLGHKEDIYYDGIITFDNGDFFVGKCVDKKEHVHFVTGKLYDAYGSILRHYDDSVELDVEIAVKEPIEFTFPGFLFSSTTHKPSLIIYDDGTIFYGEADEAEIITDDLQNNIPVDGLLTLKDGKYYIGTFVEDRIKFLDGIVYFNNGTEYAMIHDTHPILSLDQVGPKKTDRVH
jgi:hypothetical protein